MAYKKTEQYDESVTNGLMSHYTSVLQLLGEDAGREGLAKTPERMAKAMQYLTQGYSLDPIEVLNS
ncbi:MAG: GTP cyclohydrolase I, partial [Bacteroidota bacterium]